MKNTQAAPAAVPAKGIKIPKIIFIRLLLYKAIIPRNGRNEKPKAAGRQFLSFVCRMDMPVYP